MVAWLPFISLFSLATASPAARSNFVLHEKRDAVPSGFVSNGPAPPTATIPLRIGLFSNNFPKLEDTLYAVSTPGSALYGQHLSLAEAKAFMEPTADSVDAVTAWLSSNGLTSSVISPYGEWLLVNVPVSKANIMLDTNYELFTHVESGNQIIRTLSVSIPEELTAHIEALHPATGFGRPLTVGQPIFTANDRPSVNASLLPDAVPASCATTVTPACLQAMYGIPTTPATQKTNSIAVAGFIEQFAQTADLKSFLTRFRTDISSSTTFATRLFDGGKNTQSAADAGIEANLDIQYTVGLATGVPVTFVSGGETFSDGALEGFLDIINNLSGLTTVPQVLTTSYGEDEPDQSSANANKLCQAYAAYGVRGGSILFASGDGGVAGGQSQSCTNFISAFPSGCPFLTSVGAVSGIPPSETAASFSSGGFSRVFAQPTYQAAAVKTYLTALGTTNSGKFVPTGRAYPDVSTQGVDFDIVSGGSLEGVSGTSCASQVFFWLRKPNVFTRISALLSPVSS
ncbi:family S53 protease [Mycena galopus ATCC 62051]|nr:family S53 protease [Mycena galopus ATCC 62051]